MYRIYSQTLDSSTFIQECTRLHDREWREATFFSWQRHWGLDPSNARLDENSSYYIYTELIYWHLTPRSTDNGKCLETPHSTFSVVPAQVQTVMYLLFTAFNFGAATILSPTPTTAATTPAPPQTKSADFTIFPPSNTITTRSTTVPQVQPSTVQLLPSTSQTKSADMTVFPPTGISTGVTGLPTGYPMGSTGLPTTGLPTTGLPTGYSATYNPQQIQINPLTGQYLVPALQIAPGSTPPGCGTFRSCLACRQASWYGCAWNPGNLNAPVGCSQTWAASQCTGIAGPTETLAPCAAYQDCASCTNQAGCVFLIQSGSCVYSAGPSCLQNPGSCANYPAQCPAVVPYTISTYNPNSIYKIPLSYTSSVYVPGITASSIPAYYQPTTAYPVTGNPSTLLPYSTSLSTTSSTAYPATLSPVYAPTYSGYGPALPTGTLGTLTAQQYLTTQYMPYTTTQYMPVTTITTTPGPSSIPIGNGLYSTTLPSAGIRSATTVSGQTTGQTTTGQTTTTGYYPTTTTTGLSAATALSPATTTPTTNGLYLGQPTTTATYPGTGQTSIYPATSTIQYGATSGAPLGYQYYPQP